MAVIVSSWYSTFKHTNKNTSNKIEMLLCGNMEGRTLTGLLSFEYGNLIQKLFKVIYFFQIVISTVAVAVVQTIGVKLSE